MRISMTADERTILNDLLNGLENLALSVDAMEASLIGRGLLSKGEIESYCGRMPQAAVSLLAPTRALIASLPTT
jgi:hypothetical protein